MTGWGLQMTDISTDADQYTGRGLMEFLDNAIAKGWFNIHSARALKTACQKVFDVESGWEDVDLRTLDTDALLDRWQNLRRNKYSDGSLSTYRTRFKQATKMYTARLEDDPAWRSYGPATRASTPRMNGTPKKTTPAPTPPDGASDDDSTPDPTPSALPHPARPSLMDFPFPLRDDLDVFLRLPRDLRATEADRLCTFIQSLARQDPPTGITRPTTQATSEA
jgi:hypothetical protein